MKTRLALAALLFGCCFSTAAAWTPPSDYFLYWLNADAAVIGPKDPSVAYVSLKHYVITGDNVRVLTYVDDPRNNHHTVMVDLFQCAAGRYALLSMAEYDAHDKRVREFPPDERLRSLATVDTLSRVGALAAGVCYMDTGPRPMELVPGYFADLDKLMKRRRLQ